MTSKLKYAILLILPFFLYGCTGGGDTTPTPTPTTAQEQIVLRWWGVFETEEDVQPLIDKYLAANPQVKNIEYIQKDLNGDEESYMDMIDTAIADKDQTPDIFMIHNTWAGKYSSLVTKAPSSLIQEAYFNDYYTVVKKDFYRSGTIALPHYMDAMAIIYDKNKLEAVGVEKPSTQWPEFKTLAQRLTVKDTSNKITRGGFAAGFYDNVQFKFAGINLLMLVNGVTMTNIQENAATFYTTENREDAEKALAFYNDLAATTWSKDLKKDIAAFLEGNLAMYMAPSWRLMDILNYKEKYNLNINVKVAEIPQLANYSAYWADYWGYTVSKNSPKSVEAWKFIKFLNEQENLTLFDETVKDNGRPFGIIFPRKAMNTELANDPYLGPYVVALDKAQTWYMYDGLRMKQLFETSLSKSDNVKQLPSMQTTATTIITGQ